MDDWSPKVQNVASFNIWSSLVSKISWVYFHPFIQSVQESDWYDDFDGKSKTSDFSLKPDINLA